MGRMAEHQRKLLEQMMGPEAMGLVQQHVDWWDPKVCRNYLCGTCPHDVFGNTKMDLGPCPKLHLEKVKAVFEADRAKNPTDPRFQAFEQEYQNNLYAFVEDCDRKIRASQRRLEKTPEENAKGVNLMKEIGEIELAIQSETEEVEALGEAGKVEESMKKLEAVEALKIEKTEKEKELQRLTETGGASGHQKLRVCETCGAYLSVLDSDRRLADHFGGKMHLGYHDLRQTLAGFAEQRAARLAANMGRPIGPPMNGGQPNNGHGHGHGVHHPPPPPFSAPSGPAGAPPAAPRGPSALQSGPPMTPRHHEVDPATTADLDGSAVPGHGDKRKREAAELAHDVKQERSRDEDRDRKRHRSRERSDRDRDDQYNDRSKDREHRDRDRDSRRYDDDKSRRERDDKDRTGRPERERSERSDRDRDRTGGDRERGDRDEKRREKERSRSPRRK